jgi:hypothetical protein
VEISSVYAIFVGSLKEIEHSESLVVDNMIILNLILGIEVTKFWTALSGGTVGGLL